MKAVIICGPTGAGKSSLALNLAKKYKGVIINADSVQIYREIKILSGRPTSDAVSYTHLTLPTNREV